MGEVSCPVQIMVGFNYLRVSVFVPVDDGADLGELSDQVHGILIVALPVFGLVDSRLVSLEEPALLLQVQ